MSQPPQPIFICREGGPAACMLGSAKATLLALTKTVNPNRQPRRRLEPGLAGGYRVSAGSRANGADE